MNKKIEKVLLILSCILLVASIGTSCVISQNRHHLDNCRDEECTYCNIIHIAQELIYKVIISFFSIITFIFVIYYIQLKIYTYQHIAVTSSLVIQKVQFNE